MNPSISPTEMRQVVLDRFQQHHPQRLAGCDIEERVRMEGGRVVAYCYRTDHLFAMWLIDIGLVQFYDQDGNLLPAFDLLADTRADRRAA